MTITSCERNQKIHGLFAAVIIIFCAAGSTGAEEMKQLRFDLMSKENPIDFSQIPWGISPDELKKIIPDEFHTDVKYRNNKWRVADRCTVQKYVEDTDEKLHFTATVKHKSKLYDILKEHYVFHFGEKGLWAVVVLFNSEYYPSLIKKDPIAKANIAALTDRVKTRNKKLYKTYRKLYGKPVENRASELPRTEESQDIFSKSVINRWNGADHIVIEIKSTVFSQKKGAEKESLKETYFDKSRMPGRQSAEGD